MKTIRELIGDKADVTKHKGVISIHRDDFPEAVKRLGKGDGLKVSSFEPTLLPSIGIISMARISRTDEQTGVAEHTALMIFSKMGDESSDGNIECEDVVYLATSDSIEDTSVILSPLISERIDRMKNLGIKTLLGEKEDKALMNAIIMEDAARVMKMPRKVFDYDVNVGQYGKKTNIHGVTLTGGHDLAIFCRNNDVAPMPVDNREMGDLTVSICKIIGNFSIDMNGKGADIVFIVFSCLAESHSYLIAGSRDDVSAAVIRIGKDVSISSHNKIGFDPLNIR